MLANGLPSFHHTLLQLPTLHLIHISLSDSSRTPIPSCLQVNNWGCVIYTNLCILFAAFVERTCLRLKAHFPRVCFLHMSWWLETHWAGYRTTLVSSVPTDFVPPTEALRCTCVTFLRLATSCGASLTVGHHMGFRDVHVTGVYCSEKEKKQILSKVLSYFVLLRVKVLCCCMFPGLKGV